MPLRHLIVLIANAHQYSRPVSRTAEGLPFTTQPSHDDIDVFFVDRITLLEPRRAVRLCPILRPASRD